MAGSGPAAEESWVEPGPGAETAGEPGAAAAQDDNQTPLRREPLTKCVSNGGESNKSVMRSPIIDHKSRLLFNSGATELMAQPEDRWRRTKMLSSRWEMCTTD